MNDFRKLEINGGRVEGNVLDGFRLVLPPTNEGYADAQIDDYGGSKRRDYPWRPGTRLELSAKFSHGVGTLMGTAGFGFWNAPFGDPTVPWPTLPQAAWFFYGSPPSDMPLALNSPGRGWFASTVTGWSGRALAMIPAAPLVLVLNQFQPLRKRIWPWVRKGLGITFRRLEQDMMAWHSYRLDWEKKGCTFWVNGEKVLETAVGPGGPMGFVCWLDNQYLVLRVNGRFGWGTLPVGREQALDVADLQLTPIAHLL